MPVQCDVQRVEHRRLWFAPLLWLTLVFAAAFVWAGYLFWVVP